MCVGSSLSDASIAGKATTTAVDGTQYSSSKVTFNYA